MNPLSPRASELLSAFRREPSIVERLLGVTDPRPDILAQLGETSEMAVVPHLLSAVVDRRSAIARAAAGAINRIVSSGSPEDLLRMDDAWRRSGWYATGWNRGWRALSPAMVSRFTRFGDAAAVVVGIASFHPNGHVREAAVTQLAMMAGGRELPFLLIRLNDWVPVIADRARTAVAQRITVGYGRTFLEHLPILLRLRASTRHDHDQLLDRIDALLRVPGESQALDAALGSTRTMTRRVAFQLARESVRDDHGDLLARALRDPDTVIRLGALVDARRGIGASALPSVLPEIVSDPYPAVRREALAAAAEHIPEQAVAWLRAALLDRNVVVREVARFFLLRRGLMTDFAAFYRDRARADAPSRELAAAIAGLGETGGADDVDVIAPWLAHERAPVRRAAVRAIGALDLAGNAGRIAERLRDEAPSVSHAARHLLSRPASGVGVPFLLAVLRDGPYLHSRIDALLVAAKLGKWESLVVLIEGHAAADGEVRELARALLAAWIAAQNRHFEQPTSRQVEEIGQAIHRHRLALEPAMAREITAALRFWVR